MITTDNPNALQAHIINNGHGDGQHISTKEGIVDEDIWPDSYPALTQDLVDQAEAEYVDTSEAENLLNGTDEDLASILENVITILKTNHNIDIEANLSTESKTKLKKRRDARAVLK